MKKMLALLMALMMLPTLVLGAPATATQTAPGYGGDVTVTLTVEDGKLTDVQVTGDKETQGVGSEAVKQLQQSMLDNNSVQVDIVAGATATSRAVLAAAEAALKELNVELTPSVSEGTKETLDAVQTDILVVGAGGAGLAAAATAADEGAKVVLVEMLAFTGGSTAQSGGVMARGAVEGDPEGTMTADELYEYLLSWSEDKADKEVVRAYVDNAATDLDWAFSLGDGVAETTRYHMQPENIMAIRPVGDATAAATGIVLTRAMEKGVLDRGVDLRLNTEATELIVEDGKVVGAMVTSKEGTYPIYARGGVILCTGGFAQNKELLAEYGTPNADSVIVSCTAGATGSGLIMARDIGAKIQFGNDWDTDGYHTLAATGYTNYLNMVLVNGKGVRFHREDNQLPFIYTDMIKQVGEGMLDFYFLTDSNLEPDLPGMMAMTGAEKFDTLEALTAHIGCDEATLTKTITDYNANKGKDDPETGKLAAYMQGLEAPYYCVKASPIRVVTVGGVVINKDAQVLDNQNQPIPGLYAAGELANGSFYYNVYSVCGSAVGHAIIFGRIAARTATATLK